MERTRTNTPEDGAEAPQEQKIRWKKIGGGSLRLSNPPRIIKPGEIFSAFPSDIPGAFRDVVQPLQPFEEAPARMKAASKEPPLPPLEKVVLPTYHLEPRGKSKSLFDVVDESGKAINEKALTKAVAEQFIQDLTQ